jgi:hypothetical protein
MIYISLYLGIKVGILDAMDEGDDRRRRKRPTIYISVCKHGDIAN